MDAKRLRELVDHHLDGLLNDAERRELEAELISSPAARRLLLDESRLDAALRRHFHRAQSAAAWTAELNRAAAPARTGWRARWRAAWAGIGDHVWGPAGAILVHAVLLVMLFRWVFVPSGKNEEPLLQVTLSTQPDRQLDTPPPPAVPATGVMEPALPEPEHMPRERLAMIEGGGPALPAAPAPPGARAPGLSFDVSLSSPLFAGRAPALRRERLRQLAGGAPADIEAAFDRGVRRLCAMQSPSGAWEEANHSDVETTSLALLTLMSRTETLLENAILNAIHGGTRFLIGRQGADGRILDQRRSDAHLATAVCALGEAYLLTRIGALKPALDAAVGALTAQASDESADRDPVWCLWAVQALRIALHAQCEIPDAGALRAGFERRLARQQNPAGGLYYYPQNHRDDRELAAARTAAAVVALQWLGRGDAPGTLRGMRALNQALPRGRRSAPGACAEGFLAAQAAFNAGPAAWQAWQPDFARGLLARQGRDGGWAAGDGTPTSPRDTALSLLMLATPFRYPPPA